SQTRPRRPVLVQALLRRWLWMKMMRHIVSESPATRRTTSSSLAPCPAMLWMCPLFLAIARERLPCRRQPSVSRSLAAWPLCGLPSTSMLMVQRVPGH
ncbi:hypothetical protein FOZ63_006965, partial [Perkinsus olseni]